MVEQPVTTAKTTTSTSNHNGTQYDPAFYNIYDDDSEIYKDVGKIMLIMIFLGLHSL